MPDAVGRYIEEVTMSTLNVTNPTKGVAQVLGRIPASKSRTRPAKATHFADAVARNGNSGRGEQFSTVQKAKARHPTKSMREILDERAFIYSEFCKSRR
jgi:hypothetical protein